MPAAALFCLAIAITVQLPVAMGLLAWGSGGVLLIAVIGYAILRDKGVLGGDLKGKATVTVLMMIIVIALGVLRASSWADGRLQQQLSPSLEGEDLVVVGFVEGFASHADRLQRFNLRVLSSAKSDTAIPKRLRLTLYENTAGLKHPLRGGEWLALTVRLKRPHGYANPGGFDYELWLQQQGIGATGYVRDVLVKSGSLDGFYSGLRASDVTQPKIGMWDRAVSWQHHHRQILRDRILLSQEDRRVTATLLALTLGDRDLMNASDRELVQAYGLSHLLAISGLHIGFMALVCGGLGAGVGRVLGLLMVRSRLPQWVSQNLGAVCGVAGAFVYLMMAGNGLPATRAFIMVLVGALWTVARRKQSPWFAWWLAMSLILIWQPAACLDAGFWFSFIAVAVLIFVYWQRHRWRQSARGQFWWPLICAQGMLLLLLTGVQLFWGMGVSLLSPVVNLLAIPFVSFLVVPESIAGLVLPSALGDLLLSWSRLALTFFWSMLEAGEPVVERFFLNPGVRLSLDQLIALQVGIILLLLPLPGKVRGCGLLLLCASLLSCTKLAAPVEPRPPLTLTVLDVGQGLAVVVSSPTQTLLYDTGPGYPSGFNTGEAVIVPFLNAKGIDAIDTLMISHGDSDHAGGLSGVLAGVPVEQVFFGEPLATSDTLLTGDLSRHVRDCDRDIDWRVDGVDFHILGGGGHWSSSNDQSCVLLIESQGRRFLLPGDVSRTRERTLLEHPRLQDPVDILLAPHHGSGSSSSKKWVTQLNPQHVVFSAGYRNRYRHPQAGVVDAYRQQGAEMWCTESTGALEISIDGMGHLATSAYRSSHRRFWRDSLGQSPCQ